MLQTTQSQLKKDTLDLLKKYVATGDEQAASALKRFIGANFSHQTNQEAYALMEPFRKKKKSAGPMKVQPYEAFKKKQERQQSQDVEPAVVDELVDVSLEHLIGMSEKEFVAFFDGDKKAMIDFADEHGLDLTLRSNYKHETIAEKILEAFKGGEEEE